MSYGFLFFKQICKFSHRILDAISFWKVRQHSKVTNLFLFLKLHVQNTTEINQGVTKISCKVVTYVIWINIRIKSQNLSIKKYDEMHLPSICSSVRPADVCLYQSKLILNAYVIIQLSNTEQIFLPNYGAARWLHPNSIN